MWRYIPFIFFVFTISVVTAQNSNKIDYLDSVNRQLYNFISQNLKYPEGARRMGIQGTVFVRVELAENSTINK